MTLKVVIYLWDSFKVAFQTQMKRARIAELGCSENSGKKTFFRDLSAVWEKQVRHSWDCIWLLMKLLPSMPQHGLEAADAFHLDILSADELTERMNIVRSRLLQTEIRTRDVHLTRVSESGRNTSRITFNTPGSSAHAAVLIIFKEQLYNPVWRKIKNTTMLL